MSDIYAITVSTKYDDILGVVIHQNARFLKKWYIITDPEDRATIDVVKAANYSNIELLYYDFYKNAIFNKGSACRFGQMHSISQNGYNKCTLMLDSDIYLPDNFGDIMKSCKINANVIYGITNRHDFSRLSDLRSNRGYSTESYSDKIQGFFQLFIQLEHTMYKDSRDCSECDLAFNRLFQKESHLPLTLNHLGKSGTHWWGRVNRNDFLCDI